MTDSKPSTYLSQKCVLPYMSTKNKLALSLRHLPAVQVISSTFTYHQNYIDPENPPPTIKVDNITFKIGIIQGCKAGNTLPHMRKLASTGGFPYDVDIYGYPEGSVETEKDRVDHRLNQEKTSNEEKMLGFDRHHPTTLYQKIIVENRCEALQKYDYEILKFNLRRSGATPPYSQYIQLRMLDEKGLLIGVQYWEYNKKYAEVVRALAKAIPKFFSIRHLDVTSFRALRIAKAGLTHPLTSLTISDCDENLENDPDIKAAQKVIVSRLEALYWFQHRRIHCCYARGTGSAVSILRNLKSCPLSESHVTVELKTERDALKEIKSIADQVDPVVKRNPDNSIKSVTVRNKDWEIKFYVEEVLVNGNNNTYYLHAKFKRNAVDC